MNIVDTIKQETAAFRKKIAVIDRDRRISYEDLLAAVEQAAQSLKNCGIQPFQRVAFLCDDSMDYIIVTLAVLSLGAAIVPVSPSLSMDEADAVTERIDVNFLIFDKSVYSRNNAAQISFGGICEKNFLLYRRKPENEPLPEYYALNPAFIRFSSGTTGASKGVLLSHESIIERTDAADKALKITADDTVIWVLSMSYHFVVTILLFLRRAATIVLCTGAFPESLETALKQHTGTFIYASPFHYQMMTASAAFSKEMLSHARLAISTAMKLPVSGALDFHKKFGLELTEAYGIIEVGLPFINDSGDVSKRGSVGKILPDYRLNILNPDEDGIGEVCIQGKGLFDAYFSPWLPREQVLQNGWFNTGDLGRLDADGFLFIAGREKNVINFAGMKIFPDETEAVLNQHPLVKESLVYGIPHRWYGQVPAAKIVLGEGAESDFDSNELRRFCYQYLAPYKVPKEFHCVPSLERTASGKIRRSAEMKK